MGTRQQHRTIKPVTTLLRIYTLGYIVLLVSWRTEAKYNFSVTWQCKETEVNIMVHTEAPFQGIIYTDKYRDKCFTRGIGSNFTEFTIPLGIDFVCGQIFDPKLQQTKLSVWVSFHPNLELMQDRLIQVTCMKGNVIPMNNGAAVLNLNLYSFNNEMINTPVEGEKYILRAELYNSDASHDISVRDCKAFSGNLNDNTALTDESGCPIDANIMSAFEFNQTNNRVDALIYTMFRYPTPNNTRLFIQCVVYVCPSKTCTQTSCQSKSTINTPKEASRLASSLVVYVQDPGYKKTTDCGYNSWLLGLCIAFGVLFLIMLIINIFMCTAMSCTCTKKVLVEEELEDYDPYKMGWVPESTYSNRYERGPYSNTSTLESRAPSTSSEQYAVVNSPPSRFSAPSTKERLGSSISNTYYSNHV